MGDLVIIAGATIGRERITLGAVQRSMRGVFLKSLSVNWSGDRPQLCTDAALGYRFNLDSGSDA